MTTEEESTTLAHHENEADPFLVYLNVYDVTAAGVNPFLRWLGLGFNLSCVKVHGQEYTFRAGDADIVGEDHRAGVVPFAVGEGLRLLSSIPMGRTEFDENQFLQTIHQLRNEFTAESYNLFTNNCHHFSDRLCQQLTGGNRIPWWFNRIAKIGPVCQCIIPVDELNAEMRRNPVLLSVSADDHFVPQPNFKVYLNVYIANPLLRCFGFACYRSTVQVHGREYAFRPLPKDGSSNEYIISAPKGQLDWCRGLKLRKFILIGRTQMDPEEVAARMTQLKNEHNLSCYHHLKKNCHHFSDIVCRDLTGKRIPGWVKSICTIWHFYSWMTAVIELRLELLSNYTYPGSDDHSSSDDDDQGDHGDDGHGDHGSSDDNDHGDHHGGHHGDHGDGDDGHGHDHGDHGDGDDGHGHDHGDGDHGDDHIAEVHHVDDDSSAACDGLLGCLMTTLMGQDYWATHHHM